MRAFIARRALRDYVDFMWSAGGGGVQDGTSGEHSELLLLRNVLIATSHCNQTDCNQTTIYLICRCPSC